MSFAPSARLPRRRIALAASCLLFGLLAFAGIAVFVFSGASAMSVDQPDHAWFVAERSAAATAVFTAVTSVSAPELLPFLVIAGALVWALWKRQWWRPLLLIGAMLFTVALTVLLKLFITHDWPAADQMLLGPDDQHSFPSGHTLVAAVFLLVSAYLVVSRSKRRFVAPAAASAAGLGILAVAVSRLYLGYHWLTDVSASLALALLVLGAVMLLDIGRPRFGFAGRQSP